METSHTHNSITQIAHMESDWREKQTPTRSGVFNDRSEKRWNIIVGRKKGEREKVALWPSWLACFEMLSALCSFVRSRLAFTFLFKRNVIKKSRQASSDRQDNEPSEPRFETAS